MKTPKEFDYDLFRDDEGKYFVRIKATGEISEVTIETFRYIRNEAMIMYRGQQGMPVYGKENGKSVLVERRTILALDLEETDDGVGTSWLKDDFNMEEEIINLMLMEEFKKLLTEKQLEILENCLLLGVSNREYARIKCVNEAAIRKSVGQIRKKAKIFFA